MLFRMFLLVNIIFLIACGVKSHHADSDVKLKTAEQALELIEQNNFPDTKQILLDKKKNTDEEAFHPTKYTYSLYIDPKEKTLGGIVQIKILKKDTTKPLTIDVADSVVITGVAIEQEIVTQYQRQNDKLIIPAPLLVGDKLNLTIYYYTRTFRAGSFFIKQNGINVQFWTHGEPLDTKYWLPNFDWPSYKAPVESFIYVPKNWKALSNGELKEVTEIGGTQVLYHWNEKVKVSSYLFSVLAGEMSIHKEAESDIPVSYWIPQGSDTNLLMGFKDTPEMIKFYSKLLTPYAFEKFDVGIAYDFLGAMEHASSVTFSQNLSSSRDGYDSTILTHELTHHWFGNLVTCKTWDDLWLNEGFASYFEILFSESIKGNDHFKNRIDSYRKRYFGEDIKGEEMGRVGPVYNPKTPASQKFNTASYTKGALVLHTLRYQLGDTLFFKSIKEYLKKYKYKAATTEDLRAVLENESGFNLKTFFNQWVYRAGHPHFKYTWDWNATTQTLKVVVIQNQNEEIGFFETPLDIYFNLGDETFTEKVLIHPIKQNEYSFSVEKKPLSVILDPDHLVLSQSTAEKSKEEWNYILFDKGKGKAEALQSIDQTLGFKALMRFLETNKDTYLQYLAVLKLGTYKNEPKAVELARRSLTSQDDYVRMAAAQVLGQLGDKESEDLLIRIFQADPLSYVSMYAATSLGIVGTEKSAREFLKELYREPRRDQKIYAMAITGIQQLNYRAAIPRLIELIEDQQILAPAKFLKMMVAQALGHFKETSVTPLICKELLIEKSPGISKGLISALDKMQDPKAIVCLNVIVNDSSREPDVRQAAQTLINKLNSVN